MKQNLWILGALLALATTASADVGKEELKKLSRAGLSDEVILNYVRSQGSVAKLSADELIELKQAGLGDALLGKLVALPEPAPAAPPPSTAAAKLLSDPSVVYDGRYYYPRSYFSSDYTAYCSPSLAVGVSYYYPVWVGRNCSPASWSSRRYSCGVPTVRVGFGACGSGGPRSCHR